MLSRLLSSLTLVLAGCSSAPQLDLDLHSNPEGASVYFSRRGLKSVQGKIAFVKGDVKSETLEEEFVFLGTAPLQHSTPIEEVESDATIMGVGGKVILKYREGVLRFEKAGFEPFEQRVRIEDGKIKVMADLTQQAAASTSE